MYKNWILSSIFFDAIPIPILYQMLDSVDARCRFRLIVPSLPLNESEVIPLNAPEVIQLNAPEVIQLNAPKVIPLNASEVIPLNASEVKGKFTKKDIYFSNFL